MKLVPQGDVITSIRGVPDEMGRLSQGRAQTGLGERDSFTPATASGGENIRGMEIKGRPSQRVCFLNFLVGLVV
jgi:hypothetical protein